MKLRNPIAMNANIEEVFLEAHIQPVIIQKS